jgi:hypothetical protein
VTRVIAPGAALGVLGSGQLGRMFAIAARRMGYRVHTFSPEADTPTGQVADVEVVAEYEDLDALRAFARQVDVVTFEFENVPIVAVDAIEAITPVRPCGMALQTAQQRAREKQFLADRGFPTAPFGRAASLDELWDAVARIGTPAVIKTAAFGYDGKGQHKVTTPADVEHIWTAIGHQEAVVEKFVNLQTEVSVVAARGLDGELTHYQPFENRHRDHILDVTTTLQRSRQPWRHARPRSRGTCSKNWSMSACCASNFSSTPTANCWSTSSRRGRTTPGTSPSMRPSRVSSNSRCALSARCRWARHDCLPPRQPWPISLATSGKTANRIGQRLPATAM